MARRLGQQARSRTTARSPGENWWNGATFRNSGAARRFDREGLDRLAPRTSLETRALAAQAKRANDNLAISLRPAQQLLTWIARTQESRSKDYATLESLLLKLQRDLKRDTKKGSGVFSETVRREDVLAAREKLFQLLEEFRVVTRRSRSRGRPVRPPRCRIWSKGIRS